MLLAYFREQCQLAETCRNHQCVYILELVKQTVIITGQVKLIAHELFLLTLCRYG